MKAQNSPNLFQFPLDVAGDCKVIKDIILYFLLTNKGVKLKQDFTGTEKDKNGKETMQEEQKDRIPDFIKKTLEQRGLSR